MGIEIWFYFLSYSFLWTCGAHVDQDFLTSKSSFIPLINIFAGFARAGYVFALVPGICAIRIKVAVLTWLLFLVVWLRLSLCSSQFPCHILKRSSRKILARLGVSTSGFVSRQLKLTLRGHLWNLSRGCFLMALLISQHCEPTMSQDISGRQVRHKEQLFSFTHCFFSVPFILNFPIDLYSPCLGFPGEGPSKSFSFISANVSSCPKYKNHIASFPSYDKDGIAAILLQESRIPKSSAGSLQKCFSHSGFDLALGPQPDFVSVKKSSKVVRQGHGGVAPLIRKDLPFQKISIPDEFSILKDHVQVVWCSAGSAQQGFVFCNVYLPSGQAKQLRSDICESLFCFLSRFNSYPCFVIGDFQEEPEHISAVAQAIAACTWFDAYEQIQSVKGRVLEATFSRKGWESLGPGPYRTRIDDIIANSFGLELISDVQIKRDSVIPGHCPLVVTLNLEILHEDIAVIPLKRKWQLPSLPSSQADWNAREKLCQPVLQEFLPDIIHAASSHNAEQLWQLACKLASSMLDVICCVDSKTYFGRGEIPTFSCVPTVPISPNPCKDQKLVRCCKEMLTKVQLAKNNRSLLSGDQFLLLRSSIHRKCIEAGIPIPELSTDDYDQLVFDTEQLVNLVQEYSERVAILPVSKLLSGDGKKNFRFFPKQTRNMCIPGFEADCLKLRRLSKMTRGTMFHLQTKCLTC